MITAWAFATLVRGETQSAVAAQDFVVESAEACPNQTAIESSLHSIGEEPRAGAVRVALTNRQLSITWHEAERQPVTRLLPAFDKCEDRAHAAAIVLAAIWSTPANPARTEMPASSPTAIREKTAPQSSVSSPADPYVAALAALGTIDAHGAGWGFRADLAKRHLMGALGLSLGTELTAPRSTSVGDGKARWNRTSLMIGPTFEVTSSPRWMLTGEAAAALSLWLARGDGFDEDRRNFSLAPGVTAAMRSMFDLQPARVFIELRTVAWPGSRTFESTTELSGQVHQRSLSAWEAQLNIGFAFSVRQ